MLKKERNIKGKITVHRASRNNNVRMLSGVNKGWVWNGSKAGKAWPGVEYYRPLCPYVDDSRTMYFGLRHGFKSHL